VKLLSKVKANGVSMKKIANKRKDSGVDISDNDVEKAIKYYAESNKLERERLSTTIMNGYLF